MEFMDLVSKRRSVRGFTKTPVPEDVITAMLQAAVESPSGGNCQPWHFYVVRDPSLLRQIHERSYKSSWFGTASLAIVVCAESERSAGYGERGQQLYCIQDTAAAVQSMLLCATAHGVGTCWCGAFDEAALREILDIPQNQRPVAMIPTGYAAAEKPKVKRRPMDEVVTYM